jgi:hypothetical protein
VDGTAVHVPNWDPTLDVERIPDRVCVQELAAAQLANIYITLTNAVGRLDTASH